MGHMDTDAGTSLQGLSDPEFFTRWAEARHRYAMNVAASRDTREYLVSKRDYDAVLREYRRRLEGRLE